MIATSLDEVAGWIPRARSRPRHSLRGNYTGWLEQKQKRLEQEGKQERRASTLEREWEWVRRARAPPAKSKARAPAYDTLVAQSRGEGADTAQIVIPAGARLGDPSSRPSTSPRPMAPALVEDTLLQAAARRHPRHHGPNGAGRRRSSA